MTGFEEAQPGSRVYFWSRGRHVDTPKTLPGREATHLNGCVVHTNHLIAFELETTRNSRKCSSISYNDPFYSRLSQQHICCRTFAFHNVVSSSNG